MKKTIIRAAVMALVAVMLVCVLTSCGKTVPAGSYEAEIELFGQSRNVTYTFKGGKIEAVDKITLLGNVKSETASGTYKITENADGTMDIAIDFEEEKGIFEDGTHTYEEGEGYIKIGIVKYTIVE